jgi:hypothetical protein
MWSHQGGQKLKQKKHMSFIDLFVCLHYYYYFTKALVFSSCILSICIQPSFESAWYEMEVFKFLNSCRIMTYTLLISIRYPTKVKLLFSIFTTSVMYTIPLSLNILNKTGELISKQIIVAWESQNETKFINSHYPLGLFIN